MPKNKWISLLILIAIALFGGEQAGLLDEIREELSGEHKAAVEHTAKVLEQAFANRTSDLQIQGSGTVARVLSDDNQGSRHQRFILDISPDLTVLVAHNIDLAPRLPDLQAGDRVSFFGEYEWNDRGGVIHWTHHDPANRHEDGWLELDGKRYQ